VLAEKNWQIRFDMPT